MKTYRFTVLLERWKDDVYRVVCPALPGCRARGSTRAEAIRKIRREVDRRLDVLLASGETVPQDGDSSHRKFL